MGFGDLQSLDGLRVLNAFLADKSYIEECVEKFLIFSHFLVLYLMLYRYCPTQADAVVFEAVTKAPPVNLENALRWYNHIASFTDAEKAK